MILKCSWCGKKMGEKEPIEDKRTSHTICLDCMIEKGVVKDEKEFKKMLKRQETQV
jgi:DNA-directed RNA polymerase subunit RPC12/RpoP